MRDSRKNDPLVVKSLDFLGGMAEAGGWRPPASLPEVAFAGRSNVGKSSLINALVHRRKFARVSNTPGRTREINFFKVNESFILADLPGYGYARISKEKRAAWRPLIESYLKGSPALRGVVQLLDARRTPTEDDIQMLDFLAHRETPTLLIATKVDKLRKSERDGRLKDLAKETGVELDQIIPFSAETGEGRDELAEAIVSLVKGSEARDQESGDTPP